MTLLQK